MKEKNERDNIYLEGPSGELTFGKIFKILKFSLLRFVVYALIACIIAGTISVVLVATNTTKKSVSTIIEYNYSGINAGLDPNGDPFNPERIKNVNVLNSAISNANLKDVEDLNASTLAINIGVQEVIPSDVLAYMEDLKAQANQKPDINELLNSIKYYPTRFIIYINNFDKLNLTENQALALLDEVVKAYQKDWEISYVTAPVLSTELFKELSEGNITKEYQHYENLLDYQIAHFKAFLESNSKVNYSLNGVTYASLLGELNSVVMTDYSFCNAFINENKAIKSPSIINTLTKELKDTTTKLDVLEAQINAMQKQLEKFTPNSVIIPGDDKTPSQTQTFYPAEYWALQNKQSKAILDKSTLEISKSKLEDKLATLGSNPTPDPDINAEADALLTALGKSLNNLAENAQALTVSYRENISLNDSVYPVMPVALSTEKAMSNKIIIVVFLIAIVIAAIAAISVTVKFQKAFAFKKLADKNNESEPVLENAVEDTNEDVKDEE